MDPRLHVLMFAVLDGEATPEESRELEGLLAEDAAARDEYASLRLLFERLRRVPQLDAPQGFAEAAVDRRQRNAPPERRSRSSGFANPRRKNMSPNRSKRSIWIGGGVAVAAVLAVAFFTIDYPPDGRNSAGTVAPAQRYRAEQPKAGDVKLGDQSVAQLMQTEAFDRFVKDPSTRALARDPDFQALARYQSAGLTAAATNPQAFAAVVASAKSQEMNARQTAARQVAQAKSQLQPATMQAATMQTNAKNLAEAQRQADAYSAFGNQAEAVKLLATAPQFAQVAGRYSDSLIAAARAQNFATLVASQNFADALVKNAIANSNLPAGTSNNAQEQK